MGQQPAMAEHINRLNKIRVLQLIRQEEQVSRAEIVRKTGLSAPTVTRIVDSLLHQEELVVQLGVGESSGGRPPVIVKFNGEANFVIGIDWGRTHIQGVVANLNGDVIYNHDEATNSDNQFGSDLESISYVIKQLIKESNVPFNKILGIGLAVAGFVNKETGFVEFSPNFGWKMVHIKESLQHLFPIPMVVENVSKVMAIGEFHYGIGKSFQHFVFVNIGFGIGSGIIINGKLYYGADGFAGEIGHTRIPCQFNELIQRQCVCGKQGCLECYVSGRGIAQTMQEHIIRNTDTLMYRKFKNDIKSITTRVVAEAAGKGDRLSKKVLTDAAQILGVTLANASNMFNPEAVVIGGKVLLSGDDFFDEIRDSFQHELLPHVKRPVKLLKSELIGQAAVKGAVALILNEVLELNVST